MGVLTDYIVRSGSLTRRGQIKPGSPTPPDPISARKWRVAGLSCGVEPYVYVNPDVNRYSDSNRASTLLAGESYMDNMPAGVPVVNASSISSTRDLGVLLQLADDTLPAGSYIRGDGGVYEMNTLKSYGTNNWIGFANGRRRVMGLIDMTIRVSENFVASAPDAVTFALNATPASPGSPVPISTLYFSNTQTNVPLFFSGLRFQGRLQKPFSVYSAATRASSAMRRNANNPTPLPYRGMSIWKSIQGSRFQYCLVEGFGFTINTAPPFEMGAVDSNYDDGMVYERFHFDGRIAAALDPARPRSAGGLMANKTIKGTYRDGYQGYTRRSGFAYNTNTDRQDELVTVENFQIEQIANDLTDSFAGDNGGFPGSNVEGFLGTFKYTNAYFNNQGSMHIGWAVPMHDSTNTHLTPLPTGHPVFVIRGFITDNTDYNGCLKIKVNAIPNRSEKSPVWARIEQVGINESGFFDIQNNQGVPMTGIHAAQYNPAVHKRDKHFIIFS